jgi:hypothetical protein
MKVREGLRTHSVLMAYRVSGGATLAVAATLLLVSLAGCQDVRKLGFGIRAARVDS